MAKGKRKRSSSKKRSGKKRRFISRFNRRTRRRTPLALKQHTFCERAVASHNLVINTEAAAVGHFQTFSLSKMRNEAEYAAIFEQYRIDKVVATFRYKGGTAGVGNVVGGANWNEANPLLYFKVDHNDIAADTLDKMKDSMKTKTHQFTNDNPEFSIQLRPASLAQVYKTGTPPNEITVTSPKWGVWLNTIDNDLLHYGLKAYAIAYRSGSYDPGSLEVTYKYYISFKNNE